MSETYRNQAFTEMPNCPNCGVAPGAEHTGDCSFKYAEED